MNEIARQFGELMKRWRGLSATARFALSSVAVLLGLAVIAILVANTEPTLAVLFSNLSKDDENRIVERLSTMAVTYRVDEETGTVSVPRSRVHEIRLLLAQEGIPSGNGVGFEVFDQQRFGESEFSEEVKYHRALEGELGRTISHLSGVRRARVHLVLPKRSLFSNAAQGATASVVLHLRPGWKVREDQARGIVHLVASSVRGLTPEHVTLVDGEGRKLGGGGETQEEGATDLLSFRRQVERSKEQAAQELLNTTMGAGRSMVRVAAEVDFTREERTEETYDPQGIAARSFQIVEEGAGVAGPSVGGVVGTPSNLPGGAPPVGGAASRSGLAKRSETRNFEVSKVLKHMVEPVGRVSGLQVAVVVDGKWTGEGEERKFQPLPKAELDKIRGLVATAVGIDEKRGDRVTVESVPFAEPSHYEPSWLEKWLGPYVDYIPMAVLGLLALVVLMAVRRRFLAARAQDAALQLTDGVRVKQLTAEGRTEEVRERLLAMRSGEATKQALPAGESAQTSQDRQQLSADKMEEIRALASELAGQEPEAAARVIRGWITEGGAQ